MLAAGGQAPCRAARAFGLDARDPAFWRGGLGLIEAMIANRRGWDSGR